MTMTAEEKAMLYDKALERAKKLHKDAIDMDEYIRAKQCEIIFPELAESEDEKIREAIKYCIKQGFIGCGKIDNVTPDECLAWLEKQGTPAKLSEEEQNKFAKGVLSSCALSFINYLDAHKYESKMCVSNGECEDIENSFLNAMWDRLHRYYCKYIEKQGEQKPAWSDEDEDNLRYSELHFKTFLSNTYYDTFCNWLKSLKVRLGGK